MIQRSTVFAIVAILLSLSAHLFGLRFTPTPQPARSDREAETSVVALNNAFEDIAETVSEPIQPESAPVPDQPVQTIPETEFASTPTSQALVASTGPQHVTVPDIESATAVEPQTTEPSVPEEGGAPEPETVEPAGGQEEAVADAVIASPVVPDTVPAVPVPVAPAPAVTSTFAPPVVPVVPLNAEAVDVAVSQTTVVPVSDDPEITEAIDDEDGSDLAVVASVRPRLPERRVSAEPSETRDIKAAPTPVIESPLTVYRRDGIDLTTRQNNRAQSSGRSSSGSGGSGNAGVTNYFGQVLVHLNRTAPVLVTAEGFAQVSFEINPDGTLARVEIIGGTGSKLIDDAAKAQVRSAAPFPLPPNGTREKLVFVYRIN